MMLLRSGERLSIDAAALKLSFRTRYGTVALDGKGLTEVSLDNAGNGVHRVTFVGGSTLGGFLEPEKIAIPLKLGQKVDISHDMISRMQFAGEEAPPARTTRATLSNNDILSAICPSRR